MSNILFVPESDLIENNTLKKSCSDSNLVLISLPEFNTRNGVELSRCVSEFICSQYAHLIESNKIVGIFDHSKFFSEPVVKEFKKALKNLGVDVPLIGPSEVDKLNSQI